MTIIFVKLSFFLFKNSNLFFRKFMSKKESNINCCKTDITHQSMIIIPIVPVKKSNSSQYREFIRNMTVDNSINNIIVDLDHVDDFDSYILVFLDKIQQFSLSSNKEFEIINSSSSINSVRSLLSVKQAEVENNGLHASVIRTHIEFIGNVMIRIFGDIYNFISFFGDLSINFSKMLVKPGNVRWKDFPTHFTQSGVMALPITALIVFLLGLITGYQGALQLKQFGADSYIADLIGISLTRELSPLMVAILVAGRSGSAYAAELGTMKVSEEIDSLKTMGFDIYDFLVLPRVLSVTLAMPLLVVICNVIGIVGGLLAALSTLDVTTSGYILRLQEALSLWDIGTGLIKSVVFGFLIASLGCYKGLNVSGGADAVGKFTTGSVVAGVFMIILTDAIFTLIFQAIGI